MVYNYICNIQHFCHISMGLLLFCPNDSRCSKPVDITGSKPMSVAFREFQLFPLRLLTNNNNIINNNKNN